MFLWFEKNKKENIISSIKYALLSETYKKKFQYKKAISLINKSIRYDKNNDSFYYQRSILFFLLKDYKRALKDIEIGLKLNPKIYYYYLHRADIFACLFNNEQEVKSYKDAFSLKQNAFLYYEKQVEIYENDHNSDLICFYRKQLEKIKLYV